MLILSEIDLKHFIEKYSTKDYIINFMYRAKDNIHKVWSLGVFNDRLGEYIRVETRKRLDNLYFSRIDSIILEDGIITIKMKPWNYSNAYTCKFIVYSAKHLDIEL